MNRTPILLTPGAALALGLAAAIFVGDGEGIVRAKFNGILGTEELRAALRAVAGWSPTAVVPIVPRRGRG